MRIFHCDRCSTVVAFDAQRCSACDAPLGYLHTQRAIRVLASGAEPATYTVDTDPLLMWRCMNAAWGCNWMVPVADGIVWCRSCRFTRGRPDNARPDAVEAWAVAEAAKRQLVHQLDVLGLPIEIRSDATPDGLAFDLVHVPGKGGITGHRNGVVTLDLAETDDHHREDLRRRLGAPFRSVIGHLRHEIGHYYWRRVVAGTDLDDFRQLFGDDREGYGQAVERYYAGGNRTWDRTRFVTPYAGSHPLEDWAECFGHYLHVVDIVDTAIANDMVPADPGGHRFSEPVSTADFGAIFDAWMLISAGVNAIADAVGVSTVYPIEFSATVVDKLRFVHDRVAAFRATSHAFS